MRTALRRLADDDGWRCWLCGTDVDPQTPAGSPWAASVDHVVPRSRDGADEPANRRLAHRRCNGRRGNRVPELSWPADLPVVDAVDLFDSLTRVRVGDEVLVALLVDAAAAARARGFVVERASLVLGGTWAAWVRTDRDWLSVIVRRVTSP